MLEAAAAAEESYREGQVERGYGHISSFLHRRRIPLLAAVQADIEDHEANPQLFDDDSQVGIEEECEGICGV